MSQGTFRTTTVVTACEGAGCRRQEAAGRARRHAEQGIRLCSGCGHRFVAELKALPGLYEECGTLLGGGSDQPRERTSGGPLPGMPFNTASADMRSSIVGVLRSWVAMVLDDRFGGGRHVAAIPAPGTVAELAAFLVRHSDWLAAHDAAGEVSEEVARLVRRARRVIDPDPLRRVAIGACTKPGCRGGLTATVRPSLPRFPAEITCDADPAHRWMGHEWLQLSRLLAGRRGEAAVQESGDSQNSLAEKVRWITAGDIATLWGIAPGSVYRHASEHQWRRRSQGGRTYYHDGDVRTTLEGRRRSR